MQSLGLDQSREGFRDLTEQVSCLQQFLLYLVQPFPLLRKILIPAAIIGIDSAKLVDDLDHFLDLISFTRAISAVAFP